MSKFLSILVAGMLSSCTHDYGFVMFSTECGCQSYYQGGGEVQCKSEMNPEGHIVILLECLSENTVVEFIGLENNGECYVVKASYTAKQEPLWFDDGIFTREVSFKINPKDVYEFTLIGSTVFTTDSVEVKLIKEKTINANCKGK